MTPRAHCHRCDKPLPLCLCGRIPVVPTRTGITILQHPRERRHPLGTVRIARLGLPTADVRVGVQHPDPSLPARSALLYPAAGAELLSSFTAHPAPAHLVLLDGTWSQARRIYLDNQWVRALPCLRLDPPRPSRYRIRGDDRPGGLATIEALVQALQIIEPHSPGLDGLLAAFEGLIDDQMARIHRHRAGARRQRPRRRTSRAVPALLGTAWDRMVIVHAEVRATGGQRQIVQLAAAHPASGRHFEAFVPPVDPTGRPPSRHLEYMSLPRELVMSGLSLAELRVAWLRFLPAEPVLAAWNQSTLDALVQAETPPGPRLLLKAAYCNLTRGACGSLDAVVARERLAPVEFPVHGRARTFLGGALAVAELLRRRL